MSDPSIPHPHGLNGQRRFVFHLLPNAHLDPVWLWDWREGLNEGLITVRTILELMDENPSLTFMRGESAIYEHIQKTDPTVFRQIRDRIEEGRWDVVGGTVIQPDTNLASTEILCRQYERGLQYFEKNLGVRPTVAWQADSFGHTPGLPNILSAFGMKGFSFTRPQQNEFPLNSPAFWWEGDWRNRILCYRQHWMWYCSDRGNLIETLDHTLKEAAATDLVHVGVLFGLGNHGGGPTRRHLREIAQWGHQHPEVELKYDTLHGFFETLEEEITAKEVPVLQGELGYCLRGCYSSVQKFKSLYRKTEASVAQAEITRSVIGSALPGPAVDLTEAWDTLLFNSFHDILPGSSIERAMEEQTAWVGLAMHRSLQAKFQALNQLAAKVDSSVPAPAEPDLPRDVPVLVWNAQPRPYQGLTEVEVPLDYRPISLFRDRAHECPVIAFDQAGQPLPFQVVPTEHTSMPEVPWRRRLVVPVDIPAWGWTIVQVGWRKTPVENPAEPLCTAVTQPSPCISNGEWAVSVEDERLHIARHGKNFLGREGGFELRTVEDPYGSWGGLHEEKDSYLLENVRETWRIAQSEVLESGPLRAKLWTRWKAGDSWIDLTFSIEANSPTLTVEGRLLWNERCARLKMVLPCEGAMEYDMPGGKSQREVDGQVPGGRWTVRSLAGESLGFASDVLSDFDATPDELRITLARASRYACDPTYGRGEKIWEPVVDCGELKFRCALFGADAEAESVAADLLSPPTAVIAPARPGSWPREGSLGRISPDCVQLLSLEALDKKHLNLRLQNRGDSPAHVVLQLGDATIQLGKVQPLQIRTFLLEKDRAGLWKKALDEDIATSEALSSLPADVQTV